MCEADLKHYETIRQGLADEAAIDEQTYASIAILQERLERLRATDEIFSDVSFSPALQQLAVRRSEAAVS